MLGVFFGTTHHGLSVKSRWVPLGNCSESQIGQYSQISQFVAAACEAIFRHGMHNLTLTDVGKVAGWTTGTITQ